MKELDEQYFLFSVLERFWSSSGDFWEHSWNKILDVFGDDFYTLLVYGINIYTIALYWIVGGIYTYFDLTLKPSVLRKYKIQPETNEPVDKGKVFKVALQVIFNQIFVGIPVTIVAYHLFKHRGIEDVRSVPTFQRLMLDLVVCIIIEEIMFYYSHRLLHAKFIYKYVHKQHHEWQSPISIVAEYANPIEHFLSNLLPPVVGVVVMRSHLFTTWVWFTLVILSTMKDHSGYHFPFFPANEMHDYHHLNFTNNFGVLGILDYLHGTDIQFRKSQASKRNVMLKNLKSARELFPDKTS